MGAATCRILAQRGARAVCVGDISSQEFAALTEAVGKINPSTVVQCTVLDVTSPASIDQWLRGIVEKYGDLHGAANVAGLPQPMGMRKSPAILEETDEMWDRVLEVNLNGVFYCTRAEVGIMKALPPCHRSIVNVASMASMQHNADVYAYRTSKAACAHFTQSVAKDTRGLGIRINAVSPGVTQTPMLAKFIPDMQTSGDIQQGWKDRGFDWMEPEDVARVIAWLLSEDSKSVFGANINVGAALP